jgi:hypothetical protein
MINKNTILKKRRVKGQIALEFMMTYGWALLLLMTVIAGLVYFLPKPGSMTSDKCVFGPAMPCLGVNLNSTELTIILRNSMGQGIYNLSANVTMPKQLRCNITPTNPKADDRIVITCNNTYLDMMQDSRVRMSVIYKKTKNGYDQTIGGEIYAKYN